MFYFRVPYSFIPQPTTRSTGKKTKVEQHVLMTPNQEHTYATNHNLNDLDAAWIVDERPGGPRYGRKRRLEGQWGKSGGESVVEM